MVAGTITGLSAARMLAIEAESIVSGNVDVNGNLILTKHDGTTMNAGVVKGANGTNGADATALLNVASTDTIKLTLAGAGTAASPWTLSADTKHVAFVEMYAGATPPTGWLTCDGVAVSRTTYAALFAAIGTTYGTGDGSTTFNLPNYKGRVLVDLDASQTEFATLGEVGGEKTHKLTTTEMPAHSHGETYSLNGAAGTNMGALTSSGGGTITNAQQVTGLSGGGGAHNNLQPYAVVNFIIKY